MTAVDLPDVPRILIAEADPWVRDMLTELVLSVRCDANLKVCGDGREAAEWLGANKPDLVIAAWELPGTDGLSLLHGVRQLRSKPAVPFILLSNRNDSASVREALPLAPSAYLTKPLNMDSLRQRLEGLLPGAEVVCEVPAMAPGLTLDKFLDQRRDVADGAPLYVDVGEAIKHSRNAAGMDVRLLEHELRSDPQLTAVLIAAANSAAQHLGKPAQTLAQAIQTLGATQSVNLILGLAMKRGATLSDDALIAQANQFWDLSQRTAEFARTLARLLELDQERCYCAGLLHCLGDLSVVRCLQDWVLAGGELEDEVIRHSVEQYSAAFGSALRTRWRLPLELRELIAGVYQFSSGVYTREALAMNIAAQLARLGPEDGVEELAKSKPARLLRIGSSELERLRNR